MERESPEIGLHGPITREFYHDAKGAIAWLKERITGEAIAALHHPSVGDIDLVWGKRGHPWRGDDDGYGLAHILAKHRNEFPVDTLQELLDDMQPPFRKESDCIAGKLEVSRNRSPDMGQGSQEMAADGLRSYLAAFRQREVIRPWRSGKQRNESFAERRQESSVSREDYPRSRNHSIERRRNSFAGQWCT